MRFVINKFPTLILHYCNCTLESTLFYFSACASRLMHFPRVVIYLLILFASSKRLPLDYVFETLSLPARSTILSMALRYRVSPPSFHLWSTVIWITAWLLDDRLFFILKNIQSMFLMSFLLSPPSSYRNKVILRIEQIPKWDLW